MENRFKRCTYDDPNRYSLGEVVSNTHPLLYTGATVTVVEINGVRYFKLDPGPTLFHPWRREEIQGGELFPFPGEISSDFFVPPVEPGIEKTQDYTGTGISILGAFYYADFLPGLYGAATDRLRIYVNNGDVTFFYGGSYYPSAVPSIDTTAVNTWDCILSGEDEGTVYLNGVAVFTFPVTWGMVDTGFVKISNWIEPAYLYAAYYVVQSRGAGQRVFRQIASIATGLFQLELVGQGTGIAWQNDFELYFLCAEGVYKVDVRDQSIAQVIPKTVPFEQRMAMFTYASNGRYKSLLYYKQNNIVVYFREYPFTTSYTTPAAPSPWVLDDFVFPGDVPLATEKVYCWARRSGALGVLEYDGAAWSTLAKVSIPAGTGRIATSYHYVLDRPGGGDANLCVTNLGGGDAAVYELVTGLGGPAYIQQVGTTIPGRLRNEAVNRVLVESENKISIVVDTDTGVYHSDDYAQTWTKISSTRVLFAKSGIRRLLAIQFPDAVHLWDKKAEHMIRLGTLTGNLGTGFAGDYVLQGASGILDIYQYTVEPVGDSIKRAKIERRIGGTVPSECRFTVPLELVQAGAYPFGTFVEFEDGYSQLVFSGKVNDPVGEDSRTLNEITAMGRDYSIKRNVDTDFEDEITPIMLIDSMLAVTYIGQETTPNYNSIDPGDDFTALSYYRDIRTPFVKLASFARQLHRAMLYFTPDGAGWFHPHDRENTRGLLLSNRVPGVSIVFPEQVDVDITASVVTGGKNDLGPVGYTYREDPGENILIGDTRIQLHDSAIVNHSECVQLAKNRFDTFTFEGEPGKGTTFYKLLVRNQGFIQEGEAVLFGWKDDVYDVPFELYYVVKVLPLELVTDTQFIWLSKNIILPAEARKAAESVGRDDDLVGTHYRAGQESTADAPVPSRQSTVGELRGGVSTAIIDEPTVPNFTAGDLIDVTSWQELDFSGLVNEASKSALCKIVVNDDSASSTILFRKKGKTSEQATGEVRSFVAGVDIPFERRLFLDRDYIAEIKVTPAPSSWGKIEITVIAQGL